MSLRRLYETTFIVNAALEDHDIEAVISKVSTYVSNHGGDIIETNKWGRRRLAYPINKKYNGYYVHLVYEASPSTLPILERFLVLEDTVLRHLTLLLPKRLREYRAQKALADGKAYGSISDSTETRVGENKNKPEPAAEPAKKVEEKVKTVTTEVEAIVENS